MTLTERIKTKKPQVSQSRVERLCPGCGIDLPTTWHWDGCEAARLVREVRVH